MLSKNPNTYARWRAQNSVTNALRDSPDAPPERLLQSIWQHQRLRRDSLITLDGQHLRVLHPGFGSAEGGPDFRDAVLQFGDATPVTGDIEVDIRDSGWRSHGHDKNPAFKNVILHVVWDASRPTRHQTTLCLKTILDAPLTELNLQLEHNSIRTLPENLLGKCSAPLRELDDDALSALLDQAAQVRLQNKTAHLRARARHAGWEQSLWEGLFRALGYKHNVWPMQYLAETRSLWQQGADSAFKIQSRLLGLSGLLPTELSRNKSGADDYVRRVWDGWWRERDAFAENILPRSVWRFHGLRPANHPQRRLALVAHWASDKRFAKRIELWCQTDIEDKALLDSLMKTLTVERDDFWFWHWTFRSVRMSKMQPLLGEKRVTDLAMNVIIPWLWTRAAEDGNTKLKLEMERRYNAWPAAEDNSVLRLARQRLLGRTATRRSGLNTAAAQQGLIQIVRDFCDHSNSACDGCTFPELVKNWRPYDDSDTTSTY